MTPMPSEAAANTFALHTLAGHCEKNVLKVAQMECEIQARNEHKAGRAHSAVDWEHAAKRLGEIYRSGPYRAAKPLQEAR